MSDALTGNEALGSLLPTAEPPPGAGPAEVGRRIGQARARRALTGASLGALVGLGKDQISKIERGRRKVSARELPKFAEALGVTVAHLLGQTSRPTLAMAHRLAGDTRSREDGNARRRALQLLEVEDVLAQRAAPVPAVPTASGQQVFDYARDELSQRPRNQAEAVRQGRRLAERTRHCVGLGSHELGDLPGLIERHFGVDVALSPLGTETDGLCVHGDGVALIVASTDFSQGHVRFTLAHELGHHLLGDPRDVINEGEHDMFADDLQERRVNAFAGHLLMPEDGIRETLRWLSAGRVTERSLVALMEQFGVSLAALIYQLCVMDLITYDQSRNLRGQRVGDLVAQHTSVAPTGAGITVRRTVRAPERLLSAAVDAARSRLVGLGVVATLLEREDDEALWDAVMESDSGVLI
ncbi:helix-turn-helix domain-containing protein [Actinacidiphila acidipaludis]|uniref:XRE family transcriptional regulator n=1 Tax=Actinacidiphila acidipaludis TaxID=2873382 RepID=A0ABS7Q3N3_9ACTN|nr:XRE family transcriptional regulator [Streptomyces acidipaludis]MBY8876374.1 XRE family transcriptional regulator [Streptomyces acidipaludis]